VKKGLMGETFCLRTEYGPEIAAGLIRSRCRGGDRCRNGEKERQLFEEKTPVQKGCFELKMLNGISYSRGWPTIYKCELVEDGTGSQLKVRVCDHRLGGIFLGLFFPLFGVYAATTTGFESQMKTIVTLMICAELFYLLFCGLLIWAPERQIKKELCRILHGEFVKE